MPAQTRPRRPAAPAATAPPFAYYGGKTTLAPHIVDLLPTHRHYVEPFAGSLAVLLAKPPSHMETVNDLDGHLMTFWRVLRDHPQDLMRVCALTPHSRAEQHAAYDLDLELDDLERARRVWVCLTHGRAGKLRRTGWRHFQDPGPRGTTSMPDYLAAYIDRMASATNRLAQVSLEARPALDVIRDYGQHPDVLIYADPPYLGSTRGWGNQYVHELRTDIDHQELAEALLSCRASVVLSGYDSPLYAALYAHWQVVRLPSQTGNGGASRDRTEVLWSNRALGSDHLFGTT